MIPICLPWNKTDPGSMLEKGTQLVVTGWGKFTNNESINEANVNEFDAPSRTLQKLVIPLVENDQCLNIPALKNFNPEIQLCSGAEKGEDNFFYWATFLWAPSPNWPEYNLVLVQGNGGGARCTVAKSCPDDTCFIPNGTELFSLSISLTYPKSSPSQRSISE